jgi:threonine synthase
MEQAHSVSVLEAIHCIGCGKPAAQACGNCRCAHCGDLLEVTYPELAFRDPATLRDLWRARRRSNALSDQSGVWRFRELLPFLRDPNHPVTLREGNTPLYEMPRCARWAGLDQLRAKHQGMNPTGSFKDTGMTAAVSRAREDGFTWVACASTGNTSASMAAYAARAGLRGLVLLPEGKIAGGKLAQSLDYGALTCPLRTDFDGCARILNELVARLPIYLVNSVNPYRLEGQKTAAFELLEQLDWEVPDHVVVPGGNLANISALGKAFIELEDWGFIDRLPRVSVVQAEGANPLVRSLRENGGKQLVPVKAETLATAIRIGNPASWKKALRVLEQTGGACLDVTEVEIAVAKAEIGEEGIGCEPASAATLAGVRKLVGQGFIQRGESVVLILTGHMLKDPDYTLAFRRGELFAGAETERATAPYRRTAEPLEASVDAVLRFIDRAPKTGLTS